MREHFAQALAPAADASAEVALGLRRRLRQGAGLRRPRPSLRPVDAQDALDRATARRAAGPSRTSSSSIPASRWPARSGACSAPSPCAGATRHSEARARALPRVVGFLAIARRSPLVFARRLAARTAPRPLADGRRSGAALSRGRRARRPPGALRALRAGREPAPAALEAAREARPRRSERRQDGGRPRRVGEGDRGRGRRPGRSTTRWDSPPARAAPPAEAAQDFERALAEAAAGAGSRPGARVDGARRTAATPRRAPCCSGTCAKPDPTPTRSPRSPSSRPISATPTAAVATIADGAGPGRRELAEGRARGPDLRPRRETRRRPWRRCARSRAEGKLDRAVLRADPAYLPIATDPAWVGFLAEPSAVTSRPPPSASSPRTARLFREARSPRAARRRTGPRPRESRARMQVIAPSAADRDQILDQRERLGIRGAHGRRAPSRRPKPASSAAKVGAGCRPTAAANVAHGDPPPLAPLRQALVKPGRALVPRARADQRVRELVREHRPARSPAPAASASTDTRIFPS